LLTRTAAIVDSDIYTFPDARFLDETLARLIALDRATLVPNRVFTGADVVSILPWRIASATVDTTRVKIVSARRQEFENDSGIRAAARLRPRPSTSTCREHPAPMARRNGYIETRRLLRAAPKRPTRAARKAHMAPTEFAALLASIRHMRDRICTMTVAEATLLRAELSAEAARLCRCAGVTDSIVQRFAADIVDEAVRRRYSRRPQA
jgi:hypothetical protein